MITNGSYWLSFDGQNKITIGLPQTIKTARDTVSQIEDRRTDVTDKELIPVLVVVKAIFEGRW